MAPTTETPKPASPKGLAERLAQKQAELANNSKANMLMLDLDSDNERLNWSCDTAKFLELVKPSSTGDSEGLMVSLRGRFNFKIDGHDYTFDLSHARGGGAWVMVKMVS